jgi:hypothetical protein
VPESEGSNVWTRGFVGLVLCIVGGVFVAQGTGALHGSGMTGHGQYAVLGAALIVIGLGLVVWAIRVRKRRA